jgi:hypothetical protein
MLTDMEFIDHLAEEVIERFLLNHSPENELCEVETHLLHCPDCVEHVELVEIEIAVFKHCLQKMRDRQFTTVAPDADRIHHPG